ncbi:MAG: YihY/virulence factor BrkB family protein [Labilithrix sp.]|nr:YihY/virulence factor BrkB family protein [Labilithrix sp.]
MPAEKKAPRSTEPKKELRIAENHTKPSASAQLFDGGREGESPCRVSLSAPPPSDLPARQLSDEGMTPSLPPASMADVRHPRGRLAPPLPANAPRLKRALRALRRLGHGLMLHDAMLAAPAMAFHFFLSLLPLLVFVGYVVGHIARRRGVDAVLSPVLDNLPQAAEAVVKKEVARLAGSGGSTLGPLAAVGFLWIASGGTHGLMNSIETVVGAPRRPWWKKRLYSLLWVIGSLFAFALAAFALVQWDAVVHPREPAPIASASVTPSSSEADSSRLHEKPSATVVRHEPVERSPARKRGVKILRSSGERALALSISILFATAVLATFYRLAVTHTTQLKRRVLPGAVLAVVLWMVISWAFGLYVSSLAEYAVFYGSLAAVAVLLVWLWLTSLSILVGAELNSQLEGLRD